MYDHFDSLVNQFQTVVYATQRNLIREEFNDFFQTCLTYSSYGISTGIDQHIAEKIIIRMTGLLPITEINFDLSSHFTKNFTLALLDSIREHYDHLLSTVTSADWPLFRSGLVLYLSIELLSQSNNTITLIHQMKNEECKQDLAHVLLQRLEELQKPILDLNWSSLFEIVNPEIISLKQLELTRSITTYIMSLVRFVGVNGHKKEISDNVIHHFDRLVYENRLPGEIEFFFYYKIRL